MKKGLHVSVIAALAVVSAAADDAALLQRIEALEAKMGVLQEYPEFDEMEERIDKIELATMVNKINFGADFRTRVDMFDYEYANGETASQSNVWSNRLRITMDSDITKGMKFNGRLSMYKNWSGTEINMLSGADPMQGRRPSDSSLFVERAYVDWTVIGGDVPVILTIGRQPSSDGPSHQFKDNTVRKATYSALSFDGAADGIVATIGLGATGLPEAALRLGYGKGYQSPTSSMMSYLENSAAIADSNVFGAFLDFGLGIEGSLVQLSAVGVQDVVSNTPDNTNIGDMMLYTAMIELTNIAQSNVDLFAHYAVSVVSPNGETGSMQMGDGSVYPMGLLHNTPGNTDEEQGSAFWVGARYTFEQLSMLNRPRIGVEYNQGSEYWFSFTQGSNDMANKLSTRGSAVEAYYIQPINRYANLRLGAQWINYEYTGSGFQIGAPMEVDAVGALDTLTNAYLLFDLRY